MKSNDNDDRLKKFVDDCEDVKSSKVNKDIKDLQTSVSFLTKEIDDIKSGIPSEHFDPKEMKENNLTTWDATKQKLVTPTDPSVVKVGNEHLATEADLFNTVHDVIDGTTPVEVVKVGALDSEGNTLITDKYFYPALEEYAKLEDVNKEVQDREIADNNIINGTTPVKAIDNEATNINGNKVATYDKTISNGLVEYKDGALVKSSTDITLGLNKEINDRKDADASIRGDLNALTSRVATEEHKLASESDERQMIDEIIMQDASDIRTIADNAKNLATEAKAKANEVNALATEAKTKAEEANINSAKAVADVATEVDNRTKADQALQANIDKSIEYTAGVDGKLSIERGERSEKDKILQINIDKVAKDLSDEVFDRTQDDDAIRESIAKVVEQQKKVSDDLATEVQTRTQADTDIINGKTPIIKARAGLVDTEGNVFATSDDAFMLYGSQGRDNIEYYTSLDEIVLCGQKSVNSYDLADTITEKPNGEDGPFDLIVGYFNTDNNQPYQIYIGKESRKIYYRFTTDGWYDTEWKELGSGGGGGSVGPSLPVAVIDNIATECYDAAGYKGIVKYQVYPCSPINSGVLPTPIKNGDYIEVVVTGSKVDNQITGPYPIEAPAKWAVVQRVRGIVKNYSPATTKSKALPPPDGKTLYNLSLEVKEVNSTIEPTLKRLATLTYPPM